MATWRDETKPHQEDTARTPVIAVQGLEKSFKDVHVLRGVDLEIARGQHLRPARLQRFGQDHDREDPRRPSSRRTRGR